jgi:pimeloyl-ACP methyl ester carboxylesterase
MFSCTENTNANFILKQPMLNIQNLFDKQLAQLRDGVLTQFVDSGGDGPTIILVHGLANSLEIWSQLFEKLAMRFHVIAFDLLGFGEASRPDAVYDGAFFGAQIATFIDWLGIKMDHFVGYLLGACAILHFSKYNPDRINRAVLAAPGGFGPLGARGLEEATELARSLRRPGLVMWGQCDRVFPPSNAKRAMALLPQSNLLMLDDCGHYPHWEQPEKFANAVEEFLI